MLIILPELFIQNREFYLLFLFPEFSCSVLSLRMNK